MNKVLLTILLTLSAFTCSATTTDVAVTATSPPDNVIYTKRDSAEVVALLRQNVTGNDVLFYARHFIGRPYVAHTLEVADPEQLVVDLQQLDCTTLVETVCALTLTKRQGSDKFADFCRNLERLRYRGGHMNGYLSRLHYFTWWMHDNLSRGLFDEVSDTRHFTAPLTVNNYYMSRNATSYKMLAAHPEWVERIAEMERQSNGPDGRYLPEASTALGRKALGAIHDGDVIAIVTTKAGLDYAHLGFAVWGRDGKLHLLNASMVYKRVVEDKVTLYDYLKKRRTSIGIRLLRLR